MKHHRHHGSRLKSYLIVAGIAAGVLFAATRITPVRSFFFGPPSA